MKVCYYKGNLCDSKFYNFKSGGKVGSVISPQSEGKLLNSIHKNIVDSDLRF
jgi:hypothetical protein